MTVLCVVGPTASGKTKMAVALARRLNGEVVSVDSMQIYRGMTIGTAAPTAEEMEGVPHHMVAVADPAESWSVARYVREADACVQDILRRGKRPVLVGGTGLYLDALVRGQDFATGSQGGEIRRELQEKLAKDGAEALLEALRAVDPESAARLHLRDRRVDAMVAQGLLQEVETLLQSGLPRDATALQAIGYKQFLAVAEGRATTAEAIAEVKLRSRQYAKRQLTWLRRNEAIHWILWEKTPDFSAGLQNATEFLLSAGVC